MNADRVLRIGFYLRKVFQFQCNIHENEDCIKLFIYSVLSPETWLDECMALPLYKKIIKYKKKGFIATELTYLYNIDIIIVLFLLFLQCNGRNTKNYMT